MIRLFVITFVVLVINAQGNFISFEHYKNNNGITNITYTGVQGPYGYLYFGGEDGFYQFDGKVFKRFPFNKLKKNSLPFGYVNSITNDNNAKLWISTGRGLAKFDPLTSTFETFFIDTTEAFNDFNFIHTTFFDSKNRLWVHSNMGLYLFNEKKKKFSLIVKGKPFEGEFNYNGLTTVAETNNGKILYGTKNGLLEITDSTKEKIKSVVGTVRSVKVNTKGDTWVGTDKGIYILHPNMQLSEHLHTGSSTNSLPENDIVSITFQDSANVCISTRTSGLILKNLITKKQTHIRHIEGVSSSIASNVISSTFIDNFNTLWVCTRDKGLSKVYLKSLLINHFISDKATKNGLSANSVRTFFNDSKNVLWIGLENTTGSSLNFIVEGKVKTIKEIKNCRVNSICEDNDGQLWVATNKGLHYFNKKLAKWKKLSSKYSFFSQVLLYREKVMVSCEGGLFNISKHKSLEPFPIPFRKKTMASNELGSARYIFEDSQENLWIGFWGNGLMVFNKKLGVYKHYLSSDRENTITDDIITHISEGKNRTIWVSTLNGGVNKFQNNHFTYFSNEFLDIDPVTGGFIEDAESSYWILKPQGLFKVRENEIEQINSKAGLNIGEMILGSFYMDTQKRIYIGGTFGFANTFTTLNLSKSISPKILFTEFHVFNKNISSMKDLQERKIYLNYNHNFFSIKFKSFYSPDPAAVFFKYRLMPFNKNWISAQNINQVSYTNIPSGNYTFQIKTSTNKENWTNESENFLIQISTAPWFTWWAFLIYFVLAILLLYLIRWLIKNWRYIISPRTKFVGQYKVIKLIGQGNMGRVYKAFDPNKKEEVALKVVQSDENIADDILRSFIKEAEIGARLKHENVVQVYDAGSTDSAKYLSMELIDGISLKQFIKEKEKISKNDLNFIIQNLLQGLNYIHQEAIVHRDLKSTNIMLNIENNSLKIMDFGLSASRQLISLSDRSKVVGTLAYMSPEQSIGRSVDHRSDIYSFGVILYELLFGRLPYLAENEMELIFSIHNETPEAFIISDHPLLPIVKKAMSKELSDRFQSVEEILVQLS